MNIENKIFTDEKEDSRCPFHPSLSLRLSGLYWVCFISVFLSVSGFAQRPSLFSLVSYNCENAFDTLPTPTHQDSDFLPQGRQHWTAFRFARKMQRIAQVILASDTLKPVDIAVLQEVESDTCLSYLVHQTPLASLDYRYLLTDGHDARGIRVAIVYQPLRFQLIDHRSLSLSDSLLAARGWLATRDILHAWGRLPSGDTLHVYAVHLPSQLGRGEARHKRTALLRLLAADIHALLLSSPQAQVILAGDMNAPPTSSDIRTFARLCPFMHNLVAQLPQGSYQYRGVWEWIDQIWTSPSLARLSTSVRRLTSPFLLRSDDSFGGSKPSRTYQGPVYLGGYSDHLPVVYQFPLDD